MALPNIFSKEETQKMLSRIEKLTSETQPLWGKMNVAQMLAHCAVTYELTDESKYKKPNALLKFFLKLFVKNSVVNEIKYPKNSRTAPYFLITDQRQFEQEKKRLTNHITETQNLGEAFFDGKESYSFGKLTKAEWNNMFYKHLDHHLAQFGV